MIETVIAGNPMIWHSGLAEVDGKIKAKRTVSVLAKTLISKQEDTWHEFMIEYTDIAPFPAMFIKRGDTIFVDGVEIGNQRLGGGSIARIVPRIKVDQIETPSVKSMEHNCWCDHCIRRN